MTKGPKLVDAGGRSSDAVLQTLAWARKSGFVPVVLHPRSKAAVSRDYSQPGYKPPGDEAWTEHERGIGLVTGPQRGGGLIDADLDSPAASFFAPIFMPPTPAIFGRKSKPRSHRLYRVDVAEFATVQHRDPLAKNATIMELRGDGGNQTVFPGSLHEKTGELIEWDDVAFPDVPLVPAEILLRSQRKVSFASMMADHLWTDGSRNEVCKLVSGMLAQLEWTEDEVEQLIRAVMEYTGAADKSRIPTVHLTFRRFAAGRPVAGSGKLRKFVNDDALVDRLLELAGSPNANLVSEYNERWACVSLEGRFRIADLDVPPGTPPIFYLKDDFLNQTATDYSEMVNAAGNQISKGKAWLSSQRRRSYRTADFIPGDDDPDGVLNLWTGWAVPPLTVKQAGRARLSTAAAQCAGWLELLRDVICGGDENLNNWMLHWFANILREPMDKPLTAPVMIGVEGAGKSLLLAYFGAILGDGYVVITNEEHIYGRFNSHLGSCLLLHSEEALYGGEKKHAGIIRSLITDKTRMYERKGIDARQVKNYLRLILTSNEVYAAPAKAGDRRYTVIDMRDRKLSNELRDKVLKELNGSGPAALHRYLIEMDYDPAVPRTNVKNDALMALKGINLPPLEAWWLEVLMTGQILPDYLNWAMMTAEGDDWRDWAEIVSSRALHVYMTIVLKERGARSIPNDTMLAFQLDKFTGTKLRRGQRDYVNPALEFYPQVVKQLGMRQSSILNLPDLKTCRDAFERHLGQRIEWPEDKPPRKPKPHEEI